MQTSEEKTKPGKSSGLFTTTHWSVVLRAKDGSFAALSSLVERYRQPLVVHLQANGTNFDQAEDFVQGFYAQILKRESIHFLSKVAPQEGKFRTFLLTSLKNCISDEIDKKNTLKRGGGIISASLDEVDSDGNILHSASSSTPSADLEYDRAWAQTVLRHSLVQLEKYYSAKSK